MRRLLLLSTLTGLVFALALGIEVALAGTAVPTREPPRGDPIVVSKNGTGSGTVMSVPPGIHCGKTCFHIYGGGASVTLTATPAASSAFTGWSGACTAYSTCVACFRTSTCNVPADSNGVDVTATFTLKKCVVPMVKGKPLATAKRSIKSRNCSVGKITHRALQTFKKGEVIAQTPRAGTRLSPRAKVNLVVSRGR